MTTTTPTTTGTTRIQVRRQPRPTAPPSLDLRTPSGRALPY